MTHGVGEGGLLAPEDVVRQQVVLFKGVAQEVFAHVVGVDLHGRVDAHDVLHKIQVAEGHPGFQRVGGDAAVRPEHIVHIQLIHPLLGLLLESLGRGGEVGVLVAEELVTDLAGQQHPDVGLLVDGLAAEVHAHAGPDGGDVIGPQQGDDFLQGVQHLLAGHVHLGMVGADVVGHFPGVFQIDGVLVHADGEGADLLAQHQGADGAHQRGIQAAGEQEAQRGVGVQPLVHTGDQLVADGVADGFQIVMAVVRDGGKVGVADELAAGVVVAGREGADLLAQADEVFGLAGEDDAAVIQVAVEQRADADGVPGGDEGVRLVVVDDHGELGVQFREHVQAILPVQGQDDLAVAAALEFVALLRQLPL